MLIFLKMKNMRYMRESISKKSSEVRNWSATSKLLDKNSKNNLLVSTSTSLWSCPPLHIQKKRKLKHRDPKETSIVHGSSNEVRRVHVSQSEFKLVRENHLLYVDKTSWLAKLDLNSGQYFVSRPRKFGKSMFLNMIESFF
ncbi:hypothetical protein C1646_426755 [Rhizophagus diaphanus]|nr:hypothetical protein C1646_426755 [Rhizophagus diaphanus] [Rhizophagus sp. MUCL 43196]